MSSRSLLRYTGSVKAFSPFRGRFRSLGRLLVLFLALNALVRIGLALFNQDT